MAKRNSSPFARLQVEPLRVVHVDKCILLFITDDFLLRLLILGVEILSIIAAKSKINEAHESAGGCNKEYAIIRIVSAVIMKKR